MVFSLYDLSVGVCLRVLTSQAHLLKKAEEFAKQQGISPDVFLDARLYPDMRPLLFQVHITTLFSVLSVARVTGTEPAVTFTDDDLKTLEDLQARIAKAIEVLKAADPEKFVGQEDRPVVVKIKRGDLNLSARDYLFGFIVPNMHFHLTTTHNILRHVGVPIGKQDFMSGYSADFSAKSS